MKDFIIYKLRSLLESKAKNTSANVHTKNSQGFNYTTEAQYNRAEDKIKEAGSEYNSDEMGDLYQGDGLYEMKLHTNGFMSIKESSVNFKKEVGSWNDNKSGTIRYFYAMANKGVQHDDMNDPDYADLEDSNDTHSPAQQAAIKIKVLFKDEILGFLKMHMEGESQYTADEKGAEDMVNKFGDNYTQMKQSEKLAANIEKDSNRPEIKADPNKYFDDELAYTKNNTTDSKKRRMISKIQNGILRLQNLRKAGADRDALHQEIINLKLPVLFNKNIKGLRDEQGNNLLGN